MKQQLKVYLWNVNGKGVRKIAQRHIKDLWVDEESKQVTIFIDKLYAIHELEKTDHLLNMKKWVKKAFWENYSLVLKLKWWKHEPSEKEKKVPHYVHY